MMLYEMKSKGVDFHRLAIELLRGIFHCVAEHIAYGRTNNSGLLVEISRIMASNLIICHYLGLEPEEVNENPELGLAHISMNYQGSESLVNEILQKIRLRGQERIIEKLRELTPYQLTKLLEAIHEVTVYEKMDLSAKNEIWSLRSSGENTEKWLRGAFYTPSEVTKFICENTIGSFLDRRISRISRSLGEGKIVDSVEIVRKMDEIFGLTIVDPACGPGSFLTESLMVIKSRYTMVVDLYRCLKESGIIPSGEDKYAQLIKNESDYLQYFQERIYGVDLDPAAIEVAAICLSIVSGRKRDVKFSLNSNLKEGNSLISELPVGFVRPSGGELRNLLNLRDKIRRCTTAKKKRMLVEVYENEVGRLQRGQADRSMEGVKRASQFFESLREKKTFCWELEFPEVFYSRGEDTIGGFEILVMNPPYDNLKLNVSEFKSPSHGIGIKEFKEARRRECEYFRRSRHYKFSNWGALNYYRLMVEQALTLTSSSSLLGFIIPSTFLSDRSASKIRREILLKYRIIGIFDFLERARIFKGVNQAVCIILLDKSCREKVVPLASNLEDLSELGHAKPTLIPLDRIREAFPRDFAIPKITERGWAILQKIHRNPQLSEISWIRNLRGEVDLTMYKDSLSRVDTGSVLVRGNHITRYFLKWTPDKKEGFITKDHFLKKLGKSEKVRHINEVRIVGQQVSNMMQKWRLKFCLVPPRVFLGNSCNYLVVSEQREDIEPLRLYLLALLNSRLLNWRFKLTSTNNHINNYELGSLPIRVIDWTSPSEVKLFTIIVEGVKQVFKAGEVIDVLPRVEAAIFLLYHLTSEEARVVLESGKCGQNEVEAVIRQLSELGEAVKND